MVGLSLAAALWDCRAAEMKSSPEVVRRMSLHVAQHIFSKAFFYMPSTCGQDVSGRKEEHSVLICQINEDPPGKTRSTLATQKLIQKITRSLFVLDIL